MNLRERFRNFMAGRYGGDSLNQALLILALVLMALDWATGWPFFNLLALVTLAGVLFRSLSRNYSQRQRENAWWWRQSNHLRLWWQRLGRRWRDRKQYRYFTCPHCQAELRVPRGQGKIVVKCRRCGHEFTRKS